MGVAMPVGKPASGPSSDLYHPMFFRGPDYLILCRFHFQSVRKQTLHRTSKMPRFEKGTGIPIRTNMATPQAVSAPSEPRVPDHVRVKNRRKRYLDTHPEYFGAQLELAGVAASTIRLLSLKL